jgi:UDP-glucose 4-epimerase
MDSLSGYRRLAVVTGGAGFIGSHLCDALIARGDDLICVDNLVGPSSTKNVDHLLGHPRFTLVRASVVDWARDADLTGVDTIFHEAASKNTVCMDDPELDLQVNALGTLRLLRRAHASGVRKFVHGSTGSVFGELTARQDEEHPTRPRSLYGVSKLAGESYCRVFGELFDLDYTVLRYYHVIGPRQDESDSGGVLPIFIRRCVEGQPIVIYGTGEQVRSFTSVDDVVRANLFVADEPGAAQQFYNCASGIRVSIQELADYVRMEMSSEAGIRYEDWRPGDIIDFDIDNTRIISIGLVFETDWKKMVRDVIEWKLTRGTAEAVASAVEVLPGHRSRR